MTVVERLAALESADLEGLRAGWRDAFGGPHPKVRSPELMRRLIGWHLQAEVYGGLDRQTRRVVEGVSRPKPAGPQLSPGTRISREWRGRACDVEVTMTGFLYAGQAYDSLSEIAREITGVRWNGPRFFGLRKGKAA